MSALVAVGALLAQTATSVPLQETAEGPKVGQTTYIDLEGAVGYSTNPFLSFESDDGRGFGRVSLHAVHARTTVRTTTLLSAYASNDTYTGRYGSQQSLSLNARHDAAVSEHFRIFGDVQAGYDKGGQLDTRILSVPVVRPLPGSPEIPPQLLPPGSDFLSLAGKRYWAAAHAGGQLALSPRDSFSFSTGLTRQVARNGPLPNTSSWTVPATLAYDRRLNERATAGARVTFSNTNYNGPANFRTITPQVTGTLQLSERLNLGGAIGVSFSRIDDGTRITHSTGAAADAYLCSSGERSELCARAAVDQQTATAIGPAKSVSAGINYARRLDQKSSIQASLDGSRYSTPTSILSGPIFSRSTYYRAAGSYTRSIGTRLFGGVNLSGRKLTQNGPDPKADFSGSLFIRYRFGDVQ
jgi:hypothetical protein